MSNQVFSNSTRKYVGNSSYFYLDVNSTLSNGVAAPVVYNFQQGIIEGLTYNFSTGVWSVSRPMTISISSDTVFDTAIGTGLRRLEYYKKEPGGSLLPTTYATDVFYQTTALASCYMSLIDTVIPGQEFSLYITQNSGNDLTVLGRALSAQNFSQCLITEVI